MLLRLQSQTLQLQHPRPKILKLCPAVNNTYIMVVCSSDTCDEQLVHVTSAGKTLWERNYKESLDTFGMFNEREVIVLNVAKEQIQLIDLTNYEIRKQRHGFSFQNTSQMEIHTFYDTRLLCVEERGLIGEGKLILTYYLYSSHSFEVQSQYRSQSNEWTYGNPISKANNHSKIAWWHQNPPKNQEQIVFHFWDCLKNPSGALQTVKIRNTLTNILIKQSVAFMVSQLWEALPDIYILVGTSTGLGDKNSNEVYVVDAASGVLRKSKFNLPAKNYVHLFNMGKYSALHSSDFNNIECSGESEVFYLDNPKESIALQGTWKSTSSSHFYLPGYDPNLIIEASYSKSNVSSIEITSKRLLTVGEMSLHFLLNIYQDLDDDLLQDALESMDYIQIA